MSSGFRFVVFGLSLMMLPSCAFLQQMVGGGIVKPKVKLHSVTGKLQSINSLKLELELQVTNSNDFELEFTDLQYNVKVKDTLLAEGVYNEKVLIKEKSTSNITLPLDVNLSKVFDIVTQFLNAGKKLEVLLDAKANFETSVGSIEVNVHEKKLIN